MKDAAPFAGVEGDSDGGEIPVKLLQEKPGVGFLVKAPDEEPRRQRVQGAMAELFEEPRRDGRLAGSAQAHQCDDPTQAGLPQFFKRVELGFSAHELRCSRQRMHDPGLALLPGHGQASKCCLHRFTGDLREAGSIHAGPSCRRDNSLGLEPLLGLVVQGACLRAGLDLSQTIAQQVGAAASGLRRSTPPT